MSAELSRRCLRCSHELPDQGRFCPRCGANQQATSLLPTISIKQTGLLVMTGAIVWAAAWFTQQQLAGTEPTKVFEKQGAIGNPTLHALKKTVEQNRDDIHAWRQYADAMVKALQASSAPQSDDIFELIDALREILRLDPQDRGALRAMGDLSFNQKVFDKAAEYYKQLLELTPNDTELRSRYGSVLTFLNNFAEAELQLNKVLAVKKDDFAATAYLSIVHAQKGEAAKARHYAERAIGFAPHAEARKEFEKFAKTLENQVEGQPLMPQNDSSAAAPSHTVNANSATATFDNLLRGNPVAGPKFERSELVQEKTLKIYFHNFPMQAMPVMAKDKFFTSIKSYILQAHLPTVVRVEFLDASSAELLDSLTLKPSESSLQ